MEIITLDTIKTKKILSGFKARFVHSENNTLAFWDIESGSQLPGHQHLHEQVSNVMEGSFELTVEGKAIVMTKGEIAIIKLMENHSGEALTNCKILDIFYPIREDYM